MDLSLDQVASLIPTHPRNLHRQIRRGVAPPYSREGRGKYRFAEQDVHAWLARREEMRRLTGKPHLRWFSAADLLSVAVAARVQ